MAAVADLVARERATAPILDEIRERGAAPAEYGELVIYVSRIVIGFDVRLRGPIAIMAIHVADVGIRQVNHELGLGRWRNARSADLLEKLDGDLSLEPGVADHRERQLGIATPSTGLDSVVLLQGLRRTLQIARIVVLLRRIYQVLQDAELTGAELIWCGHCITFRGGPAMRNLLRRSTTF